MTDLYAHQPAAESAAADAEASSATHHRTGLHLQRSPGNPLQAPEGLERGLSPLKAPPAVRGIVVVLLTIAGVLSVLLSAFLLVCYA